jgi:uncharacterized membrane protein HdeD (DUF308 family)
MLAGLALNWPFLMLRAVVGALFGVAALVWPAQSVIGVALLVGAYALSDGALALIVAFSMRGHPGFGSLLFEAIVRSGAGVFALLSPARAALGISNALAVWAILSGIAAISVAVALRRDLAAEWPLPLAGVLSLVVGGMLIWGPGVPPEPSWVIGPYAILFGVTLLALALRLRQLADEVVASR